MSQQTFIHFFTTLRIADPARSIRDVLSLIDPHYIDVTLYNGVDQSWLYRAEDYDGPPIGFLSLRMSKEDTIKHWQPNKLLAIDCGCSMLIAIREAIELEISPRVYGDTLPQNTDVNIGLHDIYDRNCVDGSLFGHATFSVCFWGYRNPPDIETYRAAIMKLPIIQSFQARLADTWGATQCCIYSA